jgi:hypothetical protein
MAKSSGFWKWLGGTATAILVPVAIYYATRPTTPVQKPPALPDIEVTGRVVDFEKAVLVAGAEVQLIVGGLSQSQRTNQDGSYYIKVVNTPGNAQATLSVSATGFEQSSDETSLEKIADLQNVFLKAVAVVAPPPPPPGQSPAPGGQGTGKPTPVTAKLFLPQEQLARVKAALPPPVKRMDFVTLSPHK